MMKQKTGAFSANNRIKRGQGHQRRWSAGFTMAEVLIVMAIMGVLAGVSFVAVQQHQKTLTQSQYDTIAKEIFVAAQNHLTLAKSENYRGIADMPNAKGRQGTATADSGNDDIYYFYSGDTWTNTLLEQMLPFGSVELVSGGNFIIRYQPKAARVLDVFYWTDGTTRFDANIGVDQYETLVNSYGNGNQKNYGTGLLGWCGGEEDVKTGEFLEAPVIEVENGERLLVKVKDTNTDKSGLEPQLKLIISGENGAMAVIPVKEGSNSRVAYNSTSGKFTVVLDDITQSGMHFADINDDSSIRKKDEVRFIPGENITIQAVAYSNDKLTSVMYSGEWTTNSLFGEVLITKETLGLGESTTTVTKANEVRISNIRHLENLNPAVSNLAYSGDYFNNGTISAVQTVDLDWGQFINNDATGNTINLYDKINKPNAGKTKADCFLPVSASYALTYNGQSSVAVSETETRTENHSITGIVVDNTGAGDAGGTAAISAGGVFGALTNATIKNLALIDTSVTLASGPAGALAGKLTQNAELASDKYNISNVVAYNTESFETELKTKDPTLTTVMTASGDAGGLIGLADGGYCKLEKSAAAVIVKATGGNAGGLIGTFAGGSVTGCYSGGHTVNSALSDAVIYDAANFNVTSEGAGKSAGGLIGNAGATVIEKSYSTCSAKGDTAGGLVGTATGNISNSYCTGLVKGTKATAPFEGAFAGSYTTGTATNCHYFGIVNERAELDGSGEHTGVYTYLDPVSGSSTVGGITAFDETAAAFNAFSGSDWKKAEPYNADLKVYYGNKYILQTVSQLGATGVVIKTDPADTTTAEDFVATHYGDWPAPEIFVINTKST